MLVFQHEYSGGEAGVQVPLPPVTRAGRPAEPHIRLRPLRVQPGTRRAVPRVDSGAAPGHVRGDLPDAHRMEGRAGDGVAVRGVQRRPPAGVAAPPERLRELLGQAGQVPGVQVQAQVPGVRDVHHVGIPVQGRADLAGEDGCAAGHPLVPAATRTAAGRCTSSSLVESPVETLPPAETAAGIDAGITSLVTLSTGEKITNPRHERRDRARLAVAQRRLAKKQKGSANRDKAKVKLARVHARITDRRRDFLHQLSTRIIRENQTVIIEDLAVRNMVRNHCLARAISDASWSEFRRQLEYKADWYGRDVIPIDRFYPSSKTCSACGVIAATMRLNVREWACASCGVLHDRDVNAAKVIRAAGLAVQACGDG